MRDAQQGLAEIGFTSLESDIYLYLLVNGLQSGYAIAKGIGKPAANTYKAIESLQDKGAIEISDASKSRLCRAVPWQDFLKSKQQSFEATLDNLATSFKALPEADDDEAVYQMDNSARVINAAVEAIDAAELVILADIQPAAVPQLKPALEAAAKRGVEVRVKIYEDEPIEGAHITLRQHGSQVYARTRNVSFHVNSDGAHDVIALLSADLSEVYQAFRTNSGVMNMKHYLALLHELILTDVKQNLRAGDYEAALKNLDDTDHLHPFSAEGPALKVYINKYGQ